MVTSQNYLHNLLVRPWAHSKFSGAGFDKGLDGPGGQKAGTNRIGAGQLGSVAAYRLRTGVSGLGIAAGVPEPAPYAYPRSPRPVFDGRGSHRPEGAHAPA